MNRPPGPTSAAHARLWLPLALPLVLVLVLGACTGPTANTTPDEVEGIELAEDGVFRFKEFPADTPALVYDAARFVVRNRFAGGGIVEDPTALSLETRPRGSTGANRRVQLFLQVKPSADGGARLEILAAREELREDLEAHPEEPWIRAGRDTALENRLLRDVFVVLENHRTRAAAGRR